MMLNVLANIILPQALIARLSGGIEVWVNMDAHLDSCGCPGRRRSPLEMASSVFLFFFPFFPYRRPSVS